MTFPTAPTVAAGRIYTVIAATTNATRNWVNYESQLSARAQGDLLIAIVVAYQSSATANAAFSGWTASDGKTWNEFADRSSPTGMAIGAAWRISDGTEAGSLSVTQAATVTGHAVMIMLAIPGAHITTPPEAGGITFGTTANASLATPLNPSGWDIEDTLWIAVGGNGEDATAGSFTGVTAGPAGMTDFAATAISADVVGGLNAAVAFYYATTVQSYSNGGGFTNDLSNARNAALLIAVRPANATLSQAAYGFYADGTESGATALAAQDTAPTLDLSSGDVNLGLRLRLQETGAGPVDSDEDFQLEWEKNASGVWTQVSDLPEIAAYDTAVGSSQLGQSSNSSCAAAFIGTGKPVVKSEFQLNKNGATPDFSVVAEIYASTGTFGSTALPTGSPLAVSSPIATADLSATLAWTQFTFDGSFTPTAGTTYFTAFTITNWVSGSLSYNISGGGIGTYAGNSASRSAGGSWSQWSAGFDIGFRVLTSPSVAVPYDSASLTEGAATTSRLTGGTGTFTAGKVSEDGVVNDLGLLKNNHTELLYSVTVRAADVANSDTIRFRVTRNRMAIESYAVTPTVNISKVAPPASADMLVGIPI